MNSRAEKDPTPDGQKPKFFKWASVVKNEAFMQGQLQMSGANQSKLLEKLEKNQKSVRNQAIMLKVVYGIMLAILPLVPLFAYFQLRDILNAGIIPLNVIFFVASLLFAIFFLMEIVYLLILGMASAGSFMTGDVFPWLETLPIRRRDLQKLSLVTLFRIFDVPLIVMMSFFPTIMGIVTRSPLLVVACAVSSFLAVLFSFGLTLIIAEKFTVVMTSSGNSAKASAFRILAMVGYLIAVLSTSLLLNWVFSSIDTFFTRFAQTENSEVINMLLSLIPFPFAPAYLIALTSIPVADIPTNLLATTMIGMVLFAAITWRMIRGTVSTLRSAVSLEKKAKLASKSAIPKELTPEDYEIHPTTPIRAFIKKDLRNATRDMQSFMFMLMPIILPIIMLASVGFQDIGADAEALLVLYGLLCYANAFTSMMVVVGFLNIEESGSTVLSGLPLLARDQAKGKLALMLTIQFIGNATPLFIFAGRPFFGDLVGLLLANLPISVCLILMVFQLKVVLFGKMTHKYVLEEVTISHKAPKWVLIGATVLGTLVGLIILGAFISTSVGFLAFELILAAIGGAGLVALYLNFNHLFPKGNKPRTLDSSQ